jgi:hypothetical protein
LIIYPDIECKETIAALDQREKMLLSWQNAARSKAGRIAGGQEDSLADEQELVQGEAFAKEEITEFITEEQYLADKGSRNIFKLEFLLIKLFRNAPSKCQETLFQEKRNSRKAGLASF